MQKLDPLTLIAISDAMVLNPFTGPERGLLRRCLVRRPHLSRNISLEPHGLFMCDPLRSADLG